jgi:hypothetical protein
MASTVFVIAITECLNGVMVSDVDGGFAARRYK